MKSKKGKVNNLQTSSILYLVGYYSLFHVPHVRCSLLSRFKNRYQYIAQEDNNTFTEGLYDFEFTTIANIKDTEELYNFNTKPDELYYFSTEDDTNFNTNNTIIDRRTLFSIPLEQWTHISRYTYNTFEVRPTVQLDIEYSATTKRKTWATYFPRISRPRTTLRNSFITSINTLRSTQKNISLIQPPLYMLTFWRQRQRSSEIRKTLRTTFMATTDNTTRKNILKLPAFIKNIMRTSKKSSCFSCGLNETKIPTSDCYNIFEAHDQRYRKLQNRFKIKCIQSTEEKETGNKFYGPYFRPGCFKRFLDVGIEYNERGCRRHVPRKAENYASHRFAKLELLLKDEEDACVFSPHASITPFSRAISMYARYHVCVCSKKYCNDANIFKSLHLIFHFIMSAIVVIL